MTKKNPKPYHEDFTRFFENPTREGFNNVLKNNVGELRNCEFKKEWPKEAALSKHILGMANFGGGALVIGIKENDDKTLEPVGLTVLQDKAKITNGIKSYLPNTLLNDLVDTVDFHYDANVYSKLAGKSFQVLFVEYSPGHLPFISMKDGSGIRANAIYIRREALTEEANYDDLQKILNARIETGYSTRKEIDLKTHLSQLHVLLDEIRYKIDDSFSGMTSRSITAMFSRPNPRLKEDYEDFIFRMIDRKKKRIADELDV